MFTSRSRLRPLWLLIFTLPLVSVTAALLVFAFTEGPTPPIRILPTPTLYIHPLVGQVAPNFELPALNGGTVRLSSLRGQVVFLNLWATWCEPCRREFPAFEAFSQGQNNAVVLAVNEGETADAIQPFLVELGVSSVPVLLDENFSLSRAYDADLFPSTFVMNPAGMIVAFHLGEITLEDLHQYTAEHRIEPQD